MHIKILQIKESTGIQFSNSREVFNMMREEAKADREIFWVLHLNRKNKIIEKELAAVGCLDSAPVHPREIFRKAVINSSAAIICVHNHPSGDLKPSKADDDIAKQLFFAADIMGIPIIDFIIISPKGYYSFADDGLIEVYKLQVEEKISF